MTILPYQNKALSPDERASDLLGRLDLKAKAGLMFHCIGSDTITGNAHSDEIKSMDQHIASGINHFSLHLPADDPRRMAERYNEMQKLALASGSKLPLSFSSDPRHSFSRNPMSSIFAGAFSQWPESLGMVALQSEKRMEEYGDIMRQEYLAVGLRVALHPQVDLATQPFWSRQSGGFGEDGELAGRLVQAYVRGLQGKDFGTDSVSAMVKHFPGGAPQRDGHDCHMPWGQEQDYPGDNFEYHLKPFRLAVDAGVRQVMPSYGKPMGLRYEEVAMAYNKSILDLLRNDLGFTGIICSDWCILEDCPGPADDAFTAKAWGVEHLSVEERICRALDAGVDQFGGDSCVDKLIKVVKDGKVPESRIDKSAFLILREKFLLGLIDNPFVDPDHSAAIVGNAKFVAAGAQAQADALTLVANKQIDGRATLPLAQGAKIFAEGFDEALPSKYTTVTSPSEADAIVVRLKAPFEPKGNGMLTNMFHHGSLEFKPAVLERVAELAKSAPVILEIYCDRPPVLGSLVDDASAIVCSFGVNETILLDVLFGSSSPKGKLPFDLPRSDEAVRASRCDVPFDTKDPVYRCGFGLEYDQ